MKRPAFLLVLPTLLALSALPACRVSHAGFGKVLIFGKAKDAVKLDPAQVDEGESTAVNVNLFDTLVRFKPGTTILEPCLASAWRISTDGLRYTLNLRSGIHFHDGTPFDAAAVKFNFDRQQHPHGETFQYWLNFFAPVVKGVSVQDPRTVIITLKQPDATFLTNLALPAMGMWSPSALKKYGPDCVRHPVGTGPFMFETWVPNQKIILDANPTYWGGRPKIDKLVFKPIPENSVRLLELENGLIQGMSGITPDEVERIKHHPQLKLLTAPGLNVGYLALNMDKKPLDNVLVRRAIAHAIDKHALLDAFFANGTLGAVAINPLPPIVWGYNSKVKDYTYDPAEARQLLAKAGFPHGFKLTLWALPVARPYMPEGQKVAEAIQADLKQVGIDAHIVSYEWGTYLDKLSNGDHQAALIGWSGDTGDPDNFLYTLFDPSGAQKGSASNFSFYRNPEIHQLLMAARRTSVQSKRAVMYERIQRIVHRDEPVIPLFHSIQLIAFRKNVKGFIASPMGDPEFQSVDLSPP